MNFSTKKSSVFSTWGRILLHCPAARWIPHKGTFESWGRNRRHKQLKEDYVKCRHLKKLTCKWTLRQVFIICGPEPHNPSPLHSVYVYTVCLFTQRRGGGGRVEPKRRGPQEICYLQSINSDKHLPQSPFTDPFFTWRHFAVTSISLWRVLFITQSRQSAMLQSLEMGLPHSHTRRGVCPPPPLVPGLGAHSLAWEGMGGPSSNDGTYTVVL